MSLHESDDDITLSADTLKALNEFLIEKKEKEEKFKNILEKKNSSQEVNIDEDWQLSQFWYEESTTHKLSDEAVRKVGNQGSIALISCPTLYPKIKELGPKTKVKLFEYDSRFRVYGSDYVYYNYQSPLDIPRDLAGYFDLVILDPPFLSDECLTKAALTAKFLAKHDILLCTGAIMEELASRLLGVKKCKFVPKHKNNLANEFSCFINYDSNL